MQQTETYKLNLIEKDDMFSPDALNENTQEVEKQLSRLDGAEASRDARVTALEVHKIAVGSYTGNGEDIFVDVGFTPAAVLVTKRDCAGSSYIALAVNGSDVIYVYENLSQLTIVENGFKALYQDNNNGRFISKYTTYHYIAFG